MLSFCFYYFLTLKKTPKLTKQQTNKKHPQKNPQTNKTTHTQTGTPTALIAGNSMPFYLQLSGIPARNAEAIWEVHHDFLNVHNDLGRWQSCQVQVPELRFAVAVSMLVMFINWGHCHLPLEQLCRRRNQEQLPKLQDFAAVKGDKRFQMKNAGELTNIM